MVEYWIGYSLFVSVSFTGENQKTCTPIYTHVIHASVIVHIYVLSKNLSQGYGWVVKVCGVRTHNFPILRTETDENLETFLA